MAPRGRKPNRPSAGGGFARRGAESRHKTAVRLVRVASRATRTAPMDPSMRRGPGRPHPVGRPRHAHVRRRHWSGRFMRERAGHCPVRRSAATPRKRWPRAACDGRLRFGGVRTRHDVQDGSSPRILAPAAVRGRRSQSFAEARFRGSRSRDAPRRRALSVCSTHRREIGACAERNPGVRGRRAGEPASVVPSGATSARPAGDVATGPAAHSSPDTTLHRSRKHACVRGEPTVPPAWGIVSESVSNRPCGGRHPFVR